MGGKILVIEDESSYAKWITDLLTCEGFIVEKAFTGEEGLEKAYTFLPDLIVLDLSLPDIDGIDVCLQLRKNDSLQKVTIVVLSGIENSEQIVKALDSGANEYVFKTCPPGTIVERIKINFSLGRENA